MEDAEIPSRLGRYEVLARIASGGMAEVYAGRMVGESGFAKLVAIKVMKEELLNEERFVSMFLDEARVAAHISNPHVVGMLDLGRDERGVPYLVMDLVVGASVSQLLKGDASREPQALPIPLAVEIMAQAAEGLQAAHEAKDALGTPLEIVHRDISPQNILVGVDGRTRITDFGVARAVARLTRTESGEVKGKARYFSPEQGVGRAVDRRSDIFSLGIVLWEMLTLRPLFTGRTLAEVLRSVVSSPIPSVRALRPEVPPEIANVIAQALERDVDARIQTAADVARMLRAAAELEAVPIPRSSAISAYVRERAGGTITALTEEIRSKTSDPADRAGSGGLGDAPESTDDFTDEEPTAIDAEIVRRVAAQSQARAARASPAATEAASSAPAGAAPQAATPSGYAGGNHATIPETPPFDAAPAEPTVSPGRPGEGGWATTLPLGAMAAPPESPPPATQPLRRDEPPVRADPPTTPCPRCKREVAPDALSYAQDGSRICKSCEAQETIDAADGHAVNSVAGMGYAALLSGAMGGCHWLYFVPSALAIGTAVAFFLHVARHPDTRRRMGWQLPAASICATLGLALGVLFPLFYVLVAVGVASAG